MTNIISTMVYPELNFQWCLLNQTMSFVKGINEIQANNTNCFWNLPHSTQYIQQGDFHINKAMFKNIFSLSLLMETSDY